jgi:peptidoglycan hydrolase-like protein with peptidoglycan-binding domain
MADPYRFGTRSAETLALQEKLAAFGLYGEAADGIFGRNTLAAVAAARRHFGLPEGGVDAALLGRLGLAPVAADPFKAIFTRWLLEKAATQLKGLLPMTFLAGYRTYIVAAAMLLTGIASLLGVEIPSFAGQAPGDLILQAMAFFFLRQGLKAGGGSV